MFIERAVATMISGLILGNEDLVYKTANRLLPNGDSSHYEDVVAEGWLGLTEAANRFKGEGKSDFIVFAQRQVEGSMLRFLRNVLLDAESVFPLESSTNLSFIGEDTNLKSVMMWETICEILGGGKDWDIFKLYYKDGYTMDAVGNFVNLAQSQVSRRLAASREKLKKSSFITDLF